MTLEKNDKSAILKHRIEQANDTIREAEFLIVNDKLKTAVNRIYYGMFYILMALALIYDFKTSKHQQLLGWFNKTFIKEKKIPMKYGKIVRDAFDNRSEGDYGLFITFEKDDVQKMFADMKDFIATIEAYIEKNED